MLMLFLAAVFPIKVFAQFPYSESFMNSTAPGLNFGGTPAAYLTSGNPDPSGNGYLRLTSNAGGQRGYAFSSNSFPASKGISVNFEYYTYGGNGADGICFFLFDAAVADGNFNVGSFGGGLGYTNVTATGLSRAYLGIGLDEFGNFSDGSAGGSGGTGRVQNSVTIRGAYNDSRGAYYMLTTVPVQTNYGFPIGSGTARAAAGTTGYRKAYIDIIPHAGGGFDITVKIQHDAVSTPVTVINNYYYNYASPANLKFGYAASTGGSNNYHEIRNTGVSLPAGTALTTPIQTNQTITTCSNATGSVNISGGFSTTNSPNGAINTASVDLDPATTGIQTTYTVASKGTFTSNGSGNITFAPLNNTVSGTASCNFTVADNYGATSNTATVTATINAAPNLVITNPAALCAPATVDLTAAAVTAGSDANLTFSYYTNSAATTVLSNPVAIATSGTYYIKAVGANGCSVINPVTVTINPQPTTANAGTNQSITAATPATATLNGNLPTVGTGVWSQVSGPSTATFTNASLFNNSVSNLNPGTYVFRWAITNSCTTLTSDVNVTITGTQIITFAALPAKAYGDADFNVSATASSGLAVAYTSSNPAVATVDAAGLIHILTVGTTNITATQPGNGNYAAAAPVVRILSVNKASSIITFNTLATTTYGNADFNLNATSSNGTVPVTYASNNTSVVTIVNGNIHIVGAGTVVITASQAGNANYNAATPVQQTLTVNQTALTIATNNQTKTYGTANPVLTVSYSGFVNGDTQSSLTTAPTVSTTATASSPVGTYPITASGAASANYTIAYVSGTFSVYPGIQTISFNVPPKTYGDTDFALSASASSGLPVTYSSSNTAIATVDAQGIVHIVSAGNVTITASQPGNGNYIATTNISQQLTINKAVLTITADNQTNAYGSAIPALTVSYTGFVNGDTETSLTIPATAGTTATVASAAGTYPITVAGAVSSSYIFTYQPGTFTIAPNNQTLTLASIPAKTYGDADFNLSASASSGSAVVYSSSDPTIATVDAAGRVHILAVGTTMITVSQAGNSNYQPAADVQQMLTVNQVLLTLTAVNQTKTYGSVNPTLTLNYTGFVNGETAAVLSAQPTVTTTATAASPAGTYPITITAATAPNYNIAYSAGTLTITPATLTITADDQTRVYGLANPVFTVSYSGFINGDNASGLATPPTVSTTATSTSATGTYTINVSGAASANYNITYVSGTFTVTNSAVSSVSLAQATIFENQPAGTLAGTLSAASADPNEIYTYTLVAGAGSTDNASFSIRGNQLLTAKSLDYEQKATYSVAIRATNQYGLYLDQTLTLQINDVNEAPTLAAVADQQVCAAPANQAIALSGITPGPETAQTTDLNVSSSNPALFSNLNVSSVSGSAATLSYQLAGTGTAVVTVTVKDNGGTANGGINSFNQTFTITANELPVAAVSSDKGTQISKGQTVTLTAAGGSNYRWDITPNVSGTSNSAVISVRPAQTTTYHVTTNNASGCSSTASITINVADDYAALHPANILTPNGDGKNDTWVIKNIDLYPNNTVSVFDKGGRKLMEVKGYNNDWDGSYRGSPLAEGTYYYVIDFGPGLAPLKGFITILRNR